MRYRAAFAALALVTGIAFLPSAITALTVNRPVLRNPLVANAPATTHEVEIVGFDYAFKVPATVGAGPITFRFRNGLEWPVRSTSKGRGKHDFTHSLNY